MQGRIGSLVSVATELYRMELIAQTRTLSPTEDDRRGELATIVFSALRCQRERRASFRLPGDGIVAVRSEGKTFFLDVADVSLGGIRLTSASGPPRLADVVSLLGVSFDTGWKLIDASFALVRADETFVALKLIDLSPRPRQRFRKGLYEPLFFSFLHRLAAGDLTVAPVLSGTDTSVDLSGQPQPGRAGVARVQGL